MKNTVKIILSAALLCAAAFAADARQTPAEDLAQAAARANEAAASAQGVLTLDWQRCDVKEYRNRAPGKRGQKIRLLWNCKTLQTTCPVTIQNGNAVLGAACLAAPEREENQTVSLKKMFVQAFNGAGWTLDPAQVLLPLPR